MKVLVVEDDPEMREVLKLALERESYVVDCAADGQKGSYLGRTNQYDMVLLDNVLPYKRGVEVCKELRENGKKMPILILSVRSEVDDKVKLLDSGADDYLLKPYSHRELLARMKALMRRPAIIEPVILTCGIIILNTSTNQVWKRRKEVYLTRKEFALLELLLQNKNKVVSRGAILEHVWDMEGDPFSKTVETHVLNLRRKLKSGKKTFIHNVPGRGYMIKD